MRESLLVETVVGSDLGNLLNVVAIKTVDVVHDLALVGADGSKEQQVLQAAVVAECRWLQDDLLEQLDELVRQVGSHEGLDGSRDIVGVGRFGDGSRSHLLDKLAAVNVVRGKHLRPEVELTSLDEVASLVLEHGVVVGD